MKVFGMTLMNDHGPGQVRAIVAAPSMKAAAQAYQTTVYQVQDWASVTGNAEELAVAQAEPGVVFVRPLDEKGPWRKRFHRSLRGGYGE